MTRARSSTGLPVHKFSVYGNRFLIVDQRADRSVLPTDEMRSHFARWALQDPNGVGGADNVLYLGSNGEGLTFRIFEHDGSETLSCGNGLLAVSALVCGEQESGSEGPLTWSIATELPTGRPRHVRIGSSRGCSVLHLPRPGDPPPDVYRPGGGPTGPEHAVPCPMNGGSVSARLVHPGEPHLVVSLDDGSARAETLRGRLFPSQETKQAVDLLDRWGRTVNEALRPEFPAGVHLTVMHRAAGNEIRFRTWERAIDIETSACGTGALSCAYTTWCGVGDRMPARFRVVPHRAAWSDPDAGYEVEVDESGELRLQGRPRRVYSALVTWQERSSA